jgi:hypothetical protein
VPVNVSRLRNPRRDWARVGAAGALDAYRRLERFGLLVIVALVLFFPPAQVFLREAVVICTAVITWPLGIWADMEPILRRALFG